MGRLNLVYAVNNPTAKWLSMLTVKDTVGASSAERGT